MYCIPQFGTLFCARYTQRQKNICEILCGCGYYHNFHDILGKSDENKLENVCKAYYLVRSLCCCL